MCRTHPSMHPPRLPINESTFLCSRCPSLSFSLTRCLPAYRVLRFETAEMVRKAFMTAIIVFISDPDARLGVAFLASFCALLVVFNQRPFVDPKLDTLMIAALVTQTLTLSCLSPSSSFCLCFFV